MNANPNHLEKKSLIFIILIKLKDIGKENDFILEFLLTYISP